MHLPQRSIGERRDQMQDRFLNRKAKRQLEVVHHGEYY